MSKRERIYLRVVKGALVPADPCAQSKLRSRHYKTGQVLAAELVIPRNPKFNRLVHKLGCLVVENVEAFHGMDAHTAIKRLQIEGRVACDEIGIMVANYGMVIQFIPRSLSFESMDEAEFHEAAKGICRTMAERYWPDLSPDAIQNMADCMVDE